METNNTRVLFKFENEDLNKRYLDVKTFLANVLATSAVIGSLVGSVGAYKEVDQQKYEMARTRLAETLKRIFPHVDSSMSDDELFAFANAYQEQAMMHVINELDLVVADIIDSSAKGKTKVITSEGTALELLLSGEGEELSDDELLELAEKAKNSIVSA